MDRVADINSAAGHTFAGDVSECDAVTLVPEVDEVEPVARY